MYQLGEQEGILLGIPVSSYCQLANYARKALTKAGRADAFVYFNDGPGEIQAAVATQTKVRTVVHESCTPLCPQCPAV